MKTFIKEAVRNRSGVFIFKLKRPLAWIGRNADYLPVRRVGGGCHKVDLARQAAKPQLGFPVLLVFQLMQLCGERVALASASGG